MGVVIRSLSLYYLSTLEAGTAQPPIPQGRIIRLVLNEAAEPDEIFNSWNVPGTSADGSTEKEVEFTFDPSTNGADLFVKATRRSRSTLKVPKPNANAAFTVTPMGDFALSERVDYASDVDYDLHSYAVGTELEVTVSSDLFTHPVFVSGSDVRSSNGSPTARIAMPNFDVTVDAEGGGSCTDTSTTIRIERQPNATSTLSLYGRPIGFLDAVTGCSDLYYSDLILFCATDYVVAEPGYYMYGWAENRLTDSPCSCPIAPGARLNNNFVFSAQNVEKRKALETKVEVDTSASVQTDPNDKTSAAAGMIRRTPASKGYAGEICSRSPDMVQLDAVQFCPYVLREWKGSGKAYADGNKTVEVRLDDPQNPVTLSTIYVETDKDVNITAILVKGNCSFNGKYGVNMPKTLVDTNLGDPWLKALAFRESSYRQYDCNRRPTGTPTNGSSLDSGYAVGLMQIFLIPGDATRPVGSVAKGTGLSGDEMVNLNFGVSYFQECLAAARVAIDNAVYAYETAHSGQAPPDPTDADGLPITGDDIYYLDAVARYNSGSGLKPTTRHPNRWAYWDITTLRIAGYTLTTDPPWQTIQGIVVTSVEHANAVRKLVKDLPDKGDWKNLRECPCPCVGSN